MHDCWIPCLSCYCVAHWADQSAAAVVSPQRHQMQACPAQEQLARPIALHCGDSTAEMTGDEIWVEFFGYSKKQGDPDWQNAGAQMVLTLKVISAAVCYADGLKAEKVWMPQDPRGFKFGMRYHCFMSTKCMYCHMMPKSEAVLRGQTEIAAIQCHQLTKSLPSACSLQTIMKPGSC